MLVDYSDSESDGEHTQSFKAPAAPPAAEEPPAPPKTGLSALLPKPKSRKQKGAPTDGPKKIVVNLPKIDDNADLDEPPAKKARTGGGSSGLSALLPAPKKKAGAPAAAAAPEEDVETAKDEGGNKEDDASMDQGKGEEPEKKLAPPMFVPQSVAGRKAIQPMSAFKKGGAGAKNGVQKAAIKAAAAPKKAPEKPKVSLFGSGTAVAKPKSAKRSAASSAAEYKPIMLETTAPARPPVEEPEDAMDGFEDDSTNGNLNIPYGAAADDARTGPQDLDSLARSAGLDDVAMRQLYGRKGRHVEGRNVEITTFSVDEEYKQNELDKALGKMEETKVVRSVLPGRHQLSSLLNVAQSNRTALEDSFSAGKRNRKEAGSKYGW